MKLLSKKKAVAAISIAGLGALGLVAGVVYFLTSPDFDEFAKDYLVNQIEERTGRVTTVEEFDFDLWSQLIQIDGLVLRQSTGDALLEIESIDIGLHLRTLFERKIDLSSLTLVHPRIRIDVGPDGTTNVPSPPIEAGTGSSSFEVSIGELTVEGGEITIDERRVHIDFLLSELDGTFEYTGATGVLGGRLEYEGSLEREGRPTIPYGFSADFDHSAGTVLVHRAEVTSGESKVTLQGRIDDVLHVGHGAMEYTGTVDLGFLNYFFTEEALDGTIGVGGALNFSSRDFSTNGLAEGQSLTVEGWNARNVEANFEYSFPERILSASDLRMSLVGGTVTGNANVLSLPGSPRVEIDLGYEEIDTAGLRRAYPWDRKYMIHSVATGTIDGWFEGKFRDFDFSGAATLQSADVPRDSDSVDLAVAGSTTFRATPESVRLSEATARFGSSNIRADGRIDRMDSSLQVTLESTDLGDLRFLYEPANGTGRFEGSISGPIASPQTSGRFTVRSFRHEGRTIDSLGGEATLTAGGLELREVQISEARSEVTVNGRLPFDDTKLDLDLDVIQLYGFDLAEFVPTPVDGVFRGRVHLDSIDPIRASGTVSASDLMYEDNLIGNTEAAFVLDESALALTDISIRRDGAVLFGNVHYQLAGEQLGVELRASGVSLEDLHWLGIPTAFRGVVETANFDVEGTRSRPQVRGTAVLGNLHLGEQSLPQMKIQVRTSGSTIRTEIETDEHVVIEAAFDTAIEGYPFVGSARFSDYQADQLVNISLGTIVATGSVSFGGLLMDLATLEGEGLVRTLTARFEERELRVLEPFTFQFDSERLKFSEMDFSGGVTSLQLGGTIALSRDAPIDLDITGNIDLSIMSGSYPEFLVGGAVTVEGKVGGTLGSPELIGQAHIENGSFGHRGIFLSLSALDGDLDFIGNRVNLNDLRGNAGGGEVVVRGSVGVENLELGEFDVRFDVSNVRVRNPEGLRTIVDGSLALHGTAETPRLEGDIDVTSLSYDGGFEQFLELFEGGPDTAESDNPFKDMALAVHVEGSRNISIENELASVEARLDLDIAGSFGDPSMTGRIEVGTGTLTFQGTRYRITRGSVDFVDPIRVEPIVDVQAEAELRDYRIILGINGRRDNMRLEMRSEPPLPQLEIVSLIAGGRTREELAENRAGGLIPTSEQLFRGSAATILTDLLQSRVGSRFGLLDRFRIDPFLVGAENDPVTRVTISEQITRDLTITYSQDLSSNRQQIILIEYFLNSDTSFVASRDETGAVGLDIKLRKRFQ